MSLCDQVMIFVRLFHLLADMLESILSIGLEEISCHEEATAEQPTRKEARRPADGEGASAGNGCFSPTAARRRVLPRTPGMLPAQPLRRPQPQPVPGLQPGKTLKQEPREAATRLLTYRTCQIIKGHFYFICGNLLHSSRKLIHKKLISLIFDKEFL